MHLRNKFASDYFEKLLIFFMKCLKHINSSEINVHACSIANANKAIIFYLDISLNSRIFEYNFSLLIFSENNFIIVILIDVWEVTGLADLGTRLERFSILSF